MTSWNVDRASSDDLRGGLLLYDDLMGSFVPVMIFSLVITSQASLFLCDDVMGRRLGLKQ